MHIPLYLQFCTGKNKMKEDDEARECDFPGSRPSISLILSVHVLKTISWKSFPS